MHAAQEALAVVLPFPARGVRVLAQAHTHAKPDAFFNHPTHRPLADGHQRHHSDGKEIDHISHQDEPLAALRMSVHKAAMRYPQHRARHQQHHLKHDKLDCHTRTAYPDADTVLVQAVHLHRLAPCGAWGNVSIVNARHGGAQTLPQPDGTSLHAQKMMDGKRVGQNIEYPAEQAQKQICGAHGTKRFPQRLQIIAAETYVQHHAQRDQQKQKAQQSLRTRFPVHKMLLFPKNRRTAGPPCVV